MAMQDGIRNGKVIDLVFKLRMHPPSSKQRISPSQKAAPGYRIVEFRTAALRLGRAALLCKRELENRKKRDPPAQQNRPSNIEEKVRMLARKLLLGLCRSGSGLGGRRSSGGSGRSGSRGGRLLGGAEVGLVAQRTTSRAHARGRLGGRHLGQGLLRRSGKSSGGSSGGGVSWLRLSSLGFGWGRSGGFLGGGGRRWGRSNSSDGLRG